jgi:tetratricopeptide (TPR) repeat protein
MDRINDPRRTLLICALLCALTLASFWPVVDNDFINFDDPEYVTENSHVVSGLTWENVTWAFTTRYAGNWHPLTWLSHMVDAQLFGLKPAGHHAVNLLFHTFNTMLLFLVLQTMTRATWRSALVAALFALHPLHVESVAWISERKDVLSTLFFMLTLWSYARYANGGQKSEIRDQISEVGTPSSLLHLPSSLWYCLSLLLFALGLMSKPMLVTLPFLLLLLDYWPLQRFGLSGDLAPVTSFRRSTWMGCALEKIPFLALAATASLVTLLVQSKQGAVSPISGLPFGPRVANAIASCLRYLGRIVWPTDLAIFYPHPDTTYPTSTQWPFWQIAATALLLALVSALVIRLRRSNPYLAVGWFWFVGMLVPVIGLVQVGAQAMADRYTYLPAIGVFLMFAWGAHDAFQRWPRFIPATAVAAAGLAMACAIATWFQTQRWRDSVTLFEHTLAVTSDNATAHFNLGAAYEERGKFGLALAHYRAALQIDPTYADAHYNIGHALAAQGKLQEAVEQYRAVFALKPNHAFAHNNLGNTLLDLGKPDEAVAEYIEAIRIAPDYPAPHNNLGKVLADQGKMNEAGNHFADALRLKPDYIEARAGLALSLAAQGRYQESLSHWQTVVKQRPNNAEVHFNLANVLTELGKPDEAKTEYAAALRLQPNLADQNMALGNALAQQGQPQAAEPHFLAALRLNPESPEILQRLGRFLAQQGKVDQALKHLSEAARLKPSAEAHYDLGLALVMAGKSDQALLEYQQALQMKPDWPAPMNDLAWILATHPDAGVRDGSRAVSLAKRACEIAGEKEPRYWGTLDAAYAEAGRFEEAITTAQKTRQFALDAGLTEVAEAAEQRLELYRAGRPFRQKPTPVREVGRTK